MWYLSQERGHCRNNFYMSRYCHLDIADNYLCFATPYSRHSCLDDDDDDDDMGKQNNNNNNNNN